MTLDPSIIIILLTGLALGMVHSFDPDHLIAVSTLLCNNKSLRKSVVSASVWAFGHSFVLFFVGLALLIFKVSIPDGIINLFELTAGILLIILGAFVIGPIISQKLGLTRTKNQTNYSSYPLFHKHQPNSSNEHSHSYFHKSVFIGALQGLGGSAALMLVTLATVNSVEIGLIFIFLFGLGLIFGMVCISCLLGSILAYTANNLTKIHLMIKVITGSVSIGFGLFITLNILMLSHSIW
jgi:cytochrome c biogenesis protein CcdA